MAAATIRCSLLLSFVILITGKPQLQDESGLDGEFYNELKELLSEKPVVEREIENEASYPARSKPEVPQEVLNWPSQPLHLGQVSGVSVNTLGQPVIFHRGPRIWDQWSFNISNHFQQINDGPIRENTVLTLDPETGRILHEWGSNMFYMPHGITIDRHGNYWITDVALHQVFKFKPGNMEPVITFGVRFQPGHSHRHLCKPTSVAVATTGEIFVADGYCNHRILKYNAAGELYRIIPSQTEFLSLQVPHSLALMEQWDRICVADRENMRVVCPRAGLYRRKRETNSALTIQEPDLGRVFAVAAKGDLVYAVNGPTSPMIPVSGFTIDPHTEKIIDHWSLTTTSFQNPHAIAISPNGTNLFVCEIGPNKIWKFNLVSPTLM